MISSACSRRKSLRRDRNEETSLCRCVSSSPRKIKGKGDIFVAHGRERKRGMEALCRGLDLIAKLGKRNISLLTGQGGEQPGAGAREGGRKKE